MIKRTVSFVKDDIWRIRLNRLSPSKSFLIKTLRIILLALRGFDEDKCQLRASALTFFTLLSVVPILAMTFGIAKGFGLEKLLEKLLVENLPGQETVVAQIIEFARSFLEKTSGGLIAGVGVAVLFWTVIKVLGNVERSFNDIWGIKKARSLARRFSDYLSIMLICPILLIMSSSMVVLITGRVEMIMQRISLLGAISPAIFFLMRLLPYCVIWVLFSFIYLFMPNTRVNFKSGVLAGVIAGTIYQIVQWIYVNFQIGVAKYGAIYGSFAALPLFLMWLQISWLVLLFGAEISFAHQNVETYEFEPDSLRVSYSLKKLLSLRVFHLGVKNFSAGEGPLTPAAISHRLEVPIRLVRQILYELTEAGLMVETASDGDRTGGTAYQVARDIENIRIKDVIEMMEKRGSDNIPVEHSPELDRIAESLRASGEAFEKSPANVRLKDI